MDTEATKSAVLKALDGVKSKAAAPAVSVKHVDGVLRVTLTYGSTNHPARVGADSEAIAALPVQGLRYVGSEQVDKLVGPGGNELAPQLTGDNGVTPEKASFNGANVYFLFKR